jgi:hypothetical protein
LGSPSINVISCGDQLSVVVLISALGFLGQPISFQQCCLSLLGFWILIGVNRYRVDFIKLGSHRVSSFMS